MLATQRAEKAESALAAALRAASPAPVSCEHCGLPWGDGTAHATTAWACDPSAASPSPGAETPDTDSLDFSPCPNCGRDVHNQGEPIVAHLRCEHDPDACDWCDHASMDGEGENWRCGVCRRLFDGDYREVPEPSPSPGAVEAAFRTGHEYAVVRGFDDADDAWRAFSAARRGAAGGQDG